METTSIISGKNIYKKFKGFALDIPELNIPQGFATALIGENGAGKTTLLNILSGIRLDYKGELTFFGQYNDADRETNPIVKEKIGYTGPGIYYLPQWTAKDIEEVSELLFSNFSVEEFHKWCDDLALFTGDDLYKKKNSSLSDGNKMKLMLAGVMARDTDLLILDEPASPLDPLMRDKLCQMIGDYIRDGEGKKSIFFSTHNISDMEHITDYAMIMENGTIVEQGFVEDLKEALEKIAPTGAEYHHDEIWHDGNGYAHVRSALVGSSVCIALVEGLLNLGTWQQIVLLDFDNKPRSRNITVQIIAG